MKCLKCNRDLKENFGGFAFASKELGKIRVPDIYWLQCLGCGDTFLSAGEGQKITDYIRAEIIAKIGKLPIGSFVTANEASSILGMSKQAFSKHRRIKRGFIHSYDFDGKKYYYKDSVLAFKESGDGRVLLDARNFEIHQESLDNIIPKKWDAINRVGNLHEAKTAPPIINPDHLQTRPNQSRWNKLRHAEMSQ